MKWCFIVVGTIQLARASAFPFDMDVLTPELQCRDVAQLACQRCKRRESNPGRQGSPNYTFRMRRHFPSDLRNIKLKSGLFAF